MAARYDITSNQGETLNIHVLYTDVDDKGIDLNSYSAEMKIKRSVFGSNLLHMTSGPAGFTFGLTAGITGSTGGVTGGIFLNRNAGNSGSETGGILVIAGATATGFVPSGKHLYDLELKYSPTGTVTRILEGRFDSISEVTG